MPWLQLIFETQDTQTHALSDILTEAGALAVTLEDAADQPLFEPPPGETPLWSHLRVTGLFPAEINIKQTIAHIHKELAPEPLPPWRSKPLEDKDWEREWMDNYHPIQIGQRLWIVPSWRDSPEPKAVNILLDPGLAFGTGTHPTTALCLQWLDENMQSDIHVIDFGCGSGILAIAAAKLGASQVLAIDNDPQALIATRANAEKNKVLHMIDIHSPGSAPTKTVDLLLANILAQPLMELAGLFAQRVKADGKIVLSGILEQQTSDVTNAYSNWFELDPPAQKEDWIRLSGTRKS